jgi:hypothetical protein
MLWSNTQEQTSQYDLIYPVVLTLLGSQALEDPTGALAAYQVGCPTSHTTTGISNTPTPPIAQEQAQKSRFLRHQEGQDPAAYSS